MAKPALDAASRADLAARAWADVCGLLDLQLSPLGMRAIDALSPVPGDAVVDVGCGAGQSVLQLAERVGPEGCVTGIDIARRLLDLAERRAGGLRQVRFLEADAQSVGLPDRSADGVFSRFGVMAFADPLAAFSNFRRILKSSGRLAFVCWRALEENELDLLPLRAAGLESMVDPTPFSFADAGFLRATLEAAGFEDVTLQANDERVSSGSPEAMATVLLRVGPLGKILRENPDLRTGAEPRLRAALADREEHGAVALRAATWIVTARPDARRSA
ncbi:MAG: methyltransferase domain-containing protein [Acetobacteraceae bacterium]|nr:methyltransferase domain-containing protein [Acetobacteraceae bacterium]